MAVTVPVRPVSVRWPWRYRTRQALWAGVDLIFPPQCAGCGQGGHRFCAACEARVASFEPPVCDNCGHPVEQPGQCLLCVSGTRPLAPLAGLRSAAFFEGPLQTAIHRLKYKNDIILADSLARRLACMPAGVPAEASLVVPVPLGQARAKSRGYNQAALLARGYAELRGLRCAPHGARRWRETGSQVGLSPTERRANVAGAFEGNPRVVGGQTIILVDDVCTTGATLSACAEALLAAGAAEVWGLTLSRAPISAGWADRLRQQAGRRTRRRAAP
jgi:competence protein ComFC